MLERQASYKRKLHGYPLCEFEVPDFEVRYYLISGIIRISLHIPDLLNY
jgi:hypothetical protein